MTPNMHKSPNIQGIIPNLIFSQEAYGRGNRDRSIAVMKVGNRIDPALQTNTIAGIKRNTHLKDKFHHALNFGELTSDFKERRVSSLFSQTIIKGCATAYKKVAKRLDEKTREESLRSLISAEKASEILNICYDSFIHLVEYEEIPIEKRDGNLIMVQEGKVYEYKEKLKKVREKNLKRMVESDADFIEFD